MKKMVKNLVERLTGAKIHANHTAIKGKKSSGKEDISNQKNWKSMSGDWQ